MAEENKTQQEEQLANIDNDFGVPGVKFTEMRTDDNGTSTVDMDVIDYSISSGTPLDRTVNFLQTNDSLIINPIDYYYKKYSIENNPMMQGALKRSEIDNLYDNAVAMRSQRNSLMKLGVSKQFLEYEQNRRKYSNIPETDWDFIDSSMDRRSYSGSYNPLTGKHNHIATEQEMAEWQNYMFVQDDKGAVTKVPRPSLDEMKKMFTDNNMVITTTLDRDNRYAPVLIAKPADNFVPRNMVYSTKWGAQKSFEGRLARFGLGFVQGAWYGTINSVRDTWNYFENLAYYDANNIFKDADKLQEHVMKVSDELMKSSYFSASERLLKAYQNGDYEDIKENLDFAYARLDPDIGRKMEREAQPIKWQEIDKAYESLTNKYQASQLQMGHNIENGSGMINFMSRNSEMLGYLAPQLAIGLGGGAVAVGGRMALSAGLKGLSAASKVVGFGTRATAMAVGSSQAFQEFYRTGLEAGVPRESLINMGMWVLPITAFTEFATQGYMFRNLERNLIGKLAKEEIAPAMKSYAKEFLKEGIDTATESQKKKFTFGVFGKILKNKAFREWINGGSWGAGVVNANIHELAQEIAEQIGYNTTKLYMDKSMPEYYEQGIGKFGQDKLFADGELSELVLGIVYATTLMEGMTGAIPIAIRKAKGIPDTKTDIDKQRYLAYSLLKHGPRQFYEMASEEIQKEDGIFGSKKEKVSDAFMPGEYNADDYLVPQNDFLQSLGYAEGSVIEDMATLRFVDYVQNIASMDQLAREMNLSELDMQVLSAAGFRDNISLVKALDAYSDMRRKRAEIEDLFKSFDESQESLPEGDRATRPNMEELDKIYVEYKELLENGTDELTQAFLDNQDAIFSKYIAYRQAQDKFNYYSKTEEGTKYSEASNDFVKDAKSMVNQVESELKRTLNMDEDATLTKEMKDDPNIVGRYKELWQNTIGERFTYEQLKELHSRLKGLAIKDAERRRNEELSWSDNTALKAITKRLETLEQSLGGVTPSTDKSVLEGLKTSLSELTESLMVEMVNPKSTVSVGELTALKKRFVGVLSGLEKQLGIHRESAIRSAHTNILEAERASRKNNLTEVEAVRAQSEASLIALKEQLNELNSQSREGLTAEESAALDMSIADISKQIDDLTSQLANVETSDTIDNEIDKRISESQSRDAEELFDELDDAEQIAIDNSDDISLLQIERELNKNSEKTGLSFAFPEDSKGGLQKDLPKMYQSIEGMLFELEQRKETEEEYQKRKEDAIKRLKDADNKTYLERMFTELHDEFLEAKTYIDDVINGTDNYRKKFPNGRYTPNSAMNDIRGLLKAFQSMNYLPKIFRVAQSLHGDKEFINHSTALEQTFVAQLASRGENGEANTFEKMYNEMESMSDNISNNMGEAEAINQKKILHTATLMTEMRLDHVNTIIRLGLVDANGASLISAQNLQRFNDLQPITQEILSANGNYTEEQMKVVAERKRIADDILTELHSKKSLVFSGSNLDKVFKPFTQFEKANSSVAENKGNVSTNERFLDGGQIFATDEKTVHAGETEPLTNTSRQELLKYPLFSEQQGNGDIIFSYSTIAKDGKTIALARYQLKEYFNTLMWINSEYNVNQLNELRRKMYEAGDMVETGEQEAVVNSVVSFLSVDEKDNLLKKLWQYTNAENHYGVTDKNNKHRFSIYKYQYFALTVGGDYGTGKTQLVLARALRMLNELEGKSDMNKNLVFVGITERLRKLHAETFSAQKKDGAKFIPMKGKDGFFNIIDDIIKKKQNVNKDAVYVIDEASLIGGEEFEKISDALRNTGARVLYLGDMFQMRHPKSFDSIPDVMRRTMTTTLLTHQFSSTSSLLRAVAESTRSAMINKMNKVVILPKVTEKIIGNRKLGARYVATENELFNMFANSTNDNKAIVFINEQEYNRFRNANPEAARKLDTLKDKVFFAIPEESGDTESLLQGLREQEVYLMYKFEDFAKDGVNLHSTLMASAIYTGVGRASDWVGMLALQSDVKNKNVSENEALSVGTLSGSSEFSVKARNAMDKMYKIWFSYYDSPTSTTTGNNKTTTGTTTTNHKGEKKGTLKDVVIAGDNKITVKYSRKGELLTLEYDGNKETIKIGEEDDEIDFIRTYLEEYTKKGASVTQVVPVIGTNVNGTLVEVDSHFDNGNISGTVHSIEEDKDTGVRVVKVIDINDNTVKTVTVTNKSNVIEEGDIDDTQETDEKRSNKIRYNSAIVFGNGRVSGHDVLWGSSASLVDVESSMSEEDKVRIRAIHDIIIKNAGLFSFRVQRLENGTYLNDNNEVVEAKQIIALTLSLDTQNMARLNMLLSKSVLSEEWGKVPQTKDNALESFLGAKNGMLYVGTMSEPHVPIQKDKTFTLVNAGNITVEEIAEAYDKMLEKASKTMSNQLETLKAYNIALHAYQNNTNGIFDEDGFATPLIIVATDTKIEYSKDVIPLSTLISKEEASEGVSYREDGRMIIELKGKHDGVGKMVVRMPRFNEIKINQSNQDNNPIKHVTEALIKEKNDLSNVSTSTTDEAVAELGTLRDRYNEAFAKTSLYRLLRSNISVLNAALSNKANKSSLEAKVAALFDLKIDKKGIKRIDLRGTDAQSFQLNYQKAINLLTDPNTGLATSNFYDYLDKNDNGYTLHGQKEGTTIFDVLKTNASRINNIQFSFVFDANNNLPKTGPVSSDVSEKSTSSLDINTEDVPFEKKEYASPELIGKEDAVDRISRYLGENYVISNLLFNDGYIQENGVTAAGKVSDNIFITLANLNGKVHSSTASHEIFHIVYRNFINDEAKDIMIAAVKVIQEHERSIDTNYEEWMARDFARYDRKVNNPAYTDDMRNAVTLWERIKDFLRGLIHNISNLFSVSHVENARRTLEDEYNKIIDGAYVDRVNDLIRKDGEVAYEEVEADDNIERTSFAEKHSDKRISNLYKAQAKKAEYANKVSSKSMLAMEENVKMALIQNSIYSNTNETPKADFGESIMYVLDEFREEWATLLSKDIVEVKTGQGTLSIPISEVVARGLENALAINTSDGAMSYNQAKAHLELYSMFNDRDLIQALIQVSVPSVDIMTGKFEWGSPANERFDWSSIKSDDYLSDLMKLYLSVVPNINADGSPSNFGGRLLNYKDVNSVLINVGIEASRVAKETDIDIFTAFEGVLREIIEYSPHADVIVRGKNTPVFIAKQSRIVHGLYNYLFKAGTKTELQDNFVLDYRRINHLEGGTVSEDQYLGLMDKALIYEFTDTTGSTQKMRDFVAGLVGVYSSYHIKNQNKATFYDFQQMMRVTHYQNSVWQSVSQHIKDAQTVAFRNGELNQNTAKFVHHNIKIEKIDGVRYISVRDNSYGKSFTPILSYTPETGFSFETAIGTRDNSAIDANVVKKLFNNLFKAVGRTKDNLGISFLTSDIMTAMLTAKSWRDVTDIFRKEEEGKQEKSDFMGRIFMAYGDSPRTSMPSKFLADYIGTMFTMYDIYSKEYESRINIKGETVRVSENVRELLQRVSDPSKRSSDYRIGLFEQYVPNTDILLRFLRMTSFASLNRFLASEDTVFEGQQDKAMIDSELIRYIHGGDMWIAHSMMASIVQKVKGLYSSGFNRNAEGQMSWNVALRSRAYETIVGAKSDDIMIDDVTENIGVNKDIGIASVGMKTLTPDDSVKIALRMYMQEIAKSMERPTIYVPLMPVADTGKMVFARLRTSIVNTVRGGFSLDYKAIAKEVLDIENRINEEVTVQRVHLSNVLSQLKSELGLTSISLAPAGIEARDEYYRKNNLTGMLYKASLEAHEKGVFEQLEDIVYRSPIKKDLKGIKGYNASKNMPYFGLSFQTRGDQRVLVPGGSIFGRFKGYEHLTIDASRKLLGKIRSIMGSSDILDTKARGELENALHRLYEKEFKEFATMLATIGYEQTGSAVNINRRTAASQQLVSAQSTLDTSAYYQGKGITFKPQASMFGYFMMTILANEIASNNSIDTFSFKGYMDMVKRNAPLYTPGQTPTINASWTKGDKKVYLGSMAATNPMIVYIQDKVNGGNTFQLRDGQTIYTDEGNNVDPTDGQLFQFPLYERFFRASFGGAEHSMLGDSSMTKPVSVYKTENGTIEIKRADKKMTNKDFESPVYRAMFNRMLVESDRRIQRALLNAGIAQRFSLYDTFVGNFKYMDNFEEAIDATYGDILDLQYYNDGTVNENGVKMYEVIASNIIAFMAPQSVVKGALTSINRFNPLTDDVSVEMATEVLINSGTKLIMNPAQDTNLDKLQAFPTQNESHYGVTSDDEVRNLSREYTDTKVRLQNFLRSEINDEISKELDNGNNKVAKGSRFKDIDWLTLNVETLTDEELDKVDKALEQFVNYYRKKVIDNLSASAQDLAYIDIFLSKDTSVNIPFVRQRLIQTYLNHVNRAIEARTTGSRVTQSSGEYNYIYEKDGEIYSFEDAVRSIRGDLSALTYDDYISGQLDIDIATAGFKMRNIRDVMIDDNGDTVEGEVIMPNYYKKEYGHRDNETLYQINHALFNGKYYKYDELESQIDSLIKSGAQLNKKLLFDVIDSPMMRKAISNFKVIEKFHEMHLWLYEDEFDSQGERRDKVGELMQLDTESLKRISSDSPASLVNTSVQHTIKMLMSRGVDINTLTNEDILSYVLALNGNLRSSLLEEANELVQEFNDVLSINLSRVPATSIASGGIYKVVGFHNDGNVVYIPSGMMLRNDSDFDIDALTSYMYGVDENGRIIREGAAGLRNKMNDQRRSILMHKGSQENLFTKVGTQDIEAVGELKSEIKGETLSNHTPQSIYEAYKRNMAGADAIGILANTSTSLAYLVSYSDDSATTMNGSGYLSELIGDITDSNGKPIVGPLSVLSMLGSWEQAALDNANKNVFGLYGLPAEAVNILAVLSASKSNEFIYDFFNNFYVKNVLLEYSKGSSITESMSKYDIYAIAKKRISGLRSSIERSSLKAFNELNKALPFDIQLDLQDADNVADDALELSQRVYERFLGTLLPILKNKYKLRGTTDAKYFLPNTNDNEEVLRWIDENDKYSYEKLFLPSNANDILNKDGDYYAEITAMLGDVNTDAIKADILNSIKAIAELSKLYETASGYNYLALLPKLDVAATALFRLSTVLGLRRGLPVLDTDYAQKKALIELSLGMSLEDFVEKKHPRSVNISSHMNFFKNHDERFNSLKKDEDKEFKNALEEKEKLVAAELNLPYFVQNMAQLNNIMNDFVRQMKIKQALFIQDNPKIDGLRDAFLELQQRKAMRYGNEFVEFNAAITDMVLDKFYKTKLSPNEYTVPSLTLPYKTENELMGWDRPAKELDLRNMFERNLFVTGFPQYIMDVIENRNDPNYIKALLNVKGVTEENVQDIIKKLSDNVFLNMLEYKERNNSLFTRENLSQLDQFTIYKIKDSFNDLPSTIRNMFLHYERIRNRLNRKQGSILQAIGAKFFEGSISDIFNDVRNDLLRREGLSAFMLDETRTTEEFNSDEGKLKEKFFDFLGTNDQFAVYKAKPFTVGDPENPMYVYNNGDTDNSKYRVFYKLNKEGGYDEIFRVSNSLSIDVNEEQFRKQAVFRATQYELDRIAAGDMYIKHIGPTTLYSIKTGDFRYTHTGILVRVTSKSPYSFTYKTDLDEKDILDLETKLEKRRKDINSGVLLTEGSTAYTLVHPDAEHNYSTATHPFLNDFKIVTVDMNGMEVQHKIFSDKVMPTIKDVIHEAKVGVLMSITNKSDYFKNNEDMAEKLKNHDYVNRIVQNLFKDLKSSSSNTMNAYASDVHKAQLKMAILYLNKSLPVIVKSLVKNNAEAIMNSTPEENKHGVFLEMNNTGKYTNRFAKGIENIFVGITDYGSTYGQIARKGVQDFFEQKEEYKESDQLLASATGTFDDYLALFDENIYKIKESNRIRYKDVETKQISTSEILAKNEDIKARMKLSDNGIFYLLDGDNKIARNTTITGALFGPKYTGTNVAALEIGSAVDDFARAYIPLWLEAKGTIMNGEIAQDVILDNKHNLDEASLRETLHTYMEGIYNFAVLNGFDIEVITDELWAFDDTRGKNLTNYAKDKKLYENIDESFELAGIGTRQDMIVRLTKKEKGYTIDIPVDFKTTSLTHISVKQGMSEGVSSKIRSTNKGWAAQLATIKSLMTNTYGMNIGDTFVMPLQKLSTTIDNKKVTKFGIPEELRTHLNRLNEGHSTDESGKAITFPLHKVELYGEALKELHMYMSSANQTVGYKNVSEINGDISDELNCK